MAKRFISANTFLSGSVIIEFKHKVWDTFYSDVKVIFLAFTESVAFLEYTMNAPIWPYSVPKKKKLQFES
jgi:hypothetical protein